MRFLIEPQEIIVNNHSQTYLDDRTLVDILLIVYSLHKVFKYSKIRTNNPPKIQSTSVFAYMFL